MADAEVDSGRQREALSTALILWLVERGLQRRVGFARGLEFVEEVVPCFMDPSISQNTKFESKRPRLLNKLWRRPRHTMLEV